jgi:hypothetical protein
MGSIAGKLLFKVGTRERGNLAHFGSDEVKGPGI